MNITKKLAIASIGTAVLIGVVVPQASASDRQHHDGYYCDPLVTNGNHWGWECTGTVPTPEPTATVAPTPVATSTPEPTATPEPTPVVPIDTPVPDPLHNGGVAGCWVDGCPPRGELVRPTPEVFLVPPAVYTPTATPVEAPKFVPLPPKAGTGTGDEEWSLDFKSAAIGWLSFFVGRMISFLIDLRRTRNRLD